MNKWGLKKSIHNVIQNLTSACDLMRPDGEKKAEESLALRGGGESDEVKVFPS